MPNTFAVRHPRSSSWVSLLSLACGATEPGDIPSTLSPLASSAPTGVGPGADSSGGAGVGDGLNEAGQQSPTTVHPTPGVILEQDETEVTPGDCTSGCTGDLEPAPLGCGD